MGHTVIDQSSMWRFLSRDDLPSTFEVLSLPHKTDLIRLALLEKYGGVWMDSSIILLKPLHRFVSGRLFFHGSDYDYIENWFMAAPPKDEAIAAVRRCLMNWYNQWGDLGGRSFYGRQGRSWLKTVADFSAEEINHLEKITDIPGYLSTHSCFVKVMLENAEMKIRLQSHDAHFKDWSSAFWLFLEKGWGYEKWETSLLHAVDDGLLRLSKEEATWMMKFRGVDRPAFANKMLHELYSLSHTLGQILAAHGLEEHA